MQQLVQPNLTIIGKNGYCLAYTEDVFGTPNLYANAADGWANAKFKHTDQPPDDISVPIWFSFKDPDWHVCVWAKGVIYSTTANGMKTFVNIQALLNFMNNGTINEEMVYLGWSEDLATVRIVEGGYMGFNYNSAPSSDEKGAFIFKYRGAPATPAEIDNASQPWGELNGVMLNEVFVNKNKQIDDLTKSNTTLQSALNAERNDPNAQFNILGRALAALLTTLGYKKGN